MKLLASNRSILVCAASALFVVSFVLLGEHFASVGKHTRADLATARSPRGPEREAPAQKLLENLPPSAKLLPPKVQAAARSANVPEAAASPTWLARGPFPIPNGQTEGRSDPVSGRVTAIAVDPANSSIAYVGTAQGGVYRTLNAGALWTQLMDNASAGSAGTPLAIGALAIDPTNSNNVLVGTGEGNFSGDSYFGVGLYIITNASTANAIVNGPYVQRLSDGGDVFTGRSIVSIAIDPANHNNVFCATSSGFGGILPSTYSVLPPRGLYRSTNAFAGVQGTGTPRFEKLTIDPSENNEIVTSVIVDPANANNLVCAVYSQNGTNTGGIYRTSSALAGTPTFTRSFTLEDETNVKLAANRTDTFVVYAATSEGDPNGRLYRSNDGGVTFAGALTSANGFAGGQGYYDIAIAVDPTMPERVLLGGNVGSGIYLYSTDGGASFNSSTAGLHADVHAIAIARSNTKVVYHGNDGGIWRSDDGGLNWLSLNNATFSATQFVGLAVHPKDPAFSIGGTQDNGTEFLRSTGTFTRADVGDGGYSLIDRNANDTVTVTMYHTYFNSRDSIIGTARVLNSNCASDGDWSFHGAYGGSVDATVVCDGSTDTFNGISLSDPVNFYAPQVLGPGNPNTWYFGTNRLYRSIDRADTASSVSQGFNTPISAIAISPQDDNVRVVGLNDGTVFATTTGSSTLVQIAGPGATAATPAVSVARIAIDPNDKDVAYLCFSGYGTPASPAAHVWKTTNLSSGNPQFTPASTGLPDVPVNAIAIDPFTPGPRSVSIYVGTDAGVYYSDDAGVSWNVYGSGLPHAAVWALEIQPSSRTLRAATHGRGLYDTSLAATGPGATPTPVPDTSTKLTNVSTRGIVESGDSVMIAGLIVTGPENMQVALRALGPSLANYGIAQALFDPNLTLYDAQGNQLAFNDDYTTNSQTDRAILAANLLTPRDTKEPAIVTTLSPSSYTLVLRGAISGAGLVEAYDISRSSVSSLTNLSTRGKVETGDEGTMIVGFIVNAPDGEAGQAQRLLIRARGPSLATYGLSGVLPDPTIDVYRGLQKIASNDNWGTQASTGVGTAAEIKATGLAPSNNNEPAVLATLTPGSYTAVIRGRNNSTGVALVEVYQLTQ